MQCVYLHIIIHYLYFYLAIRFITIYNQIKRFNGNSSLLGVYHNLGYVIGLGKSAESTVQLNSIFLHKRHLLSLNIASTNHEHFL